MADSNKKALVSRKEFSIQKLLTVHILLALLGMVSVQLQKHHLVQNLILFMRMILNTLTFVQLKNLEVLLKRIHILMNGQNVMVQQL